jgi:hypothetical protein
MEARMTGRDFSRAGKAARRKGASFELEVRDVLREFGYLRTHRQFQSGGQGGGDLADSIPDTHLECKRTENLQLGAAYRQACAAARPSDTVLIVHRGSGQPIQATGLLVDLHSLMQHLPMHPVVIGTRSPRPVFIAEHRLTTVSRRPMVISSLLGKAMCTVLFADWLRMTAPVAEAAA